MLKIDKNNPANWTYWLNDEPLAYDQEAKCGTVYKSPLSKSEMNDIGFFREELKVAITSGTEYRKNRTKRILELALEYFDGFEEIHGFNHFYILFEFSPERPLESIILIGDKITFHIINFVLYYCKRPVKHVFSIRHKLI